MSEEALIQNNSSHWDHFVKHLLSCGSSLVFVIQCLVSVGTKTRADEAMLRHGFAQIRTLFLGKLLSSMLLFLVISLHAVGREWPLSLGLGESYPLTCRIEQEMGVSERKKQAWESNVLF